MSTFSETTTILAYMQGIGAPSVQIVKGANKKDAAGVEILGSASTYVRFVNGDTSLGTAMLAKKVTAIDASNVRDLDVSWVEGATELGAPIKGWMVHTRGTVEVVSTFSVAELAALA